MPLIFLVAKSLHANTRSLESMTTVTDCRQVACNTIAWGHSDFGVHVASQVAINRRPGEVFENSLRYLPR